MKKYVVLLVLISSIQLTFAQSKNKVIDMVISVNNKPNPIGDKVKSCRKIDGLFTLYQDTITGGVQMYIRRNQLNKEYIYQSLSINGPTALWLHQNVYRTTFVFKIQKSFDKLEFAIVNTNFYYDKKNPISKTANVDIPETIFFSDKPITEDSAGYLIPVDPLFLSEKLDPVKPLNSLNVPPTAVFNLGFFNSAKSKYNKIRSYPNNTDIIVDLAYDNPTPYNSGGEDITDARYNRIQIQHSLLEMPQNDFKPRFDDPRIGYYTTQITDKTSISPTPYKDIISRWYLKKKDPTAALSEPEEPIVYWIENTTPYEYRQIIMEAGLKWNEAFEKAGFKNAIQMKIMPDTATWDPTDIRYNVIRWVSSANPLYAGYGPMFVNPRTGQILGTDITIEWSSGNIYQELFNTAENQSQQSNQLDRFFSNNPLCSASVELKNQLTMGLTTIDINNDEQNNENNREKIAQIHNQYLYQLVLHEMGHTLGLTHNMKASNLWSPAEINDTTLTHTYGLTNSVMDYPTVNIALDKNKQGDFFTTKPGPYDIWAIQYGYTPVANDVAEKKMLDALLIHSNDPQLAFGNDADDMRDPGKAIDPRVNVNDLTNDPIAYAEERFQLVNQIISKLKDKYIKKGQSYAALRSAYFRLHYQRENMINTISRFIGGVYVDRSFPEQHTPNKPYTAVPLATQQKAMQMLAKYVFAPDVFKGDEQVFQYLQPQRRGYNFSRNTEDPKLTNIYVNLQTAALLHILHPVTMQRITNSRLYGNTYSVAAILADLTKSIFDAEKNTSVNIYRQNIQTELVKILINGMKFYDNIARAATLYTLKKIKNRMNTFVGMNEETKAHRNAIIYLIDQALEKK